MILINLKNILLELLKYMKQVKNKLTEPRHLLFWITSRSHKL